jgi:hypothetical protein
MASCTAYGDTDEQRPQSPVMLCILREGLGDTNFVNLIINGIHAGIPHLVPGREYTWCQLSNVQVTTRGFVIETVSTMAEHRIHSAAQW